MKELLVTLKELDVRLHLEGDDLRIVAPQGALTAELKQALRLHKASLVDALRAGKTVIADALRHRCCTQRARRGGWSWSPPTTATCWRTARARWPGAKATVGVPVMRRAVRMKSP